MGQYYKPVLLDSKKYKGKNLSITGWVHPHACKTEDKHHDGGTYTSGCGLKLMEHSWLKNGFVGTVERLLVGYPKRLVWAGDYADPEEGTEENVYGLAGEKFAHLQMPETMNGEELKKHPYLVNHSKMEYVDKRETPTDSYGWRIHPLPLLTCEGNGRGGGDFRGDETNPLIGKWARDLISVERLKPSKEYTKITFDLVEN